MPTYEYRCPHCGTFEVVQRITEDPLKTCPTCGQPVNRLISRNVGIVFKGSGFYVTDSRASRNGSRRDSASDAGDDSGSPEESTEPAAI